MASTKSDFSKPTSSIEMSIKRTLAPYSWSRDLMNLLMLCKIYQRHELFVPIPYQFDGSLPGDLTSTYVPRWSCSRSLAHNHPLRVTYTWALAHSPSRGGPMVVSVFDHKQHGRPRHVCGGGQNCRIFYQSQIYPSRYHYSWGYL